MDEKILRRLGLSMRQATHLKDNWQTSTKVSDLAKRLKTNEQAVRRMARKLGLGARPVPEEGSHLDPSPDEIKERAAAVRASWTPAERRQRECYDRPSRWTPPTIQIGEIEPPSYARI